MEKGSKEWLEAKKAGKAALDTGAFPPATVSNGTVGHEEGAPGTWNTSGVELPVNAGAVRDVRPETSTAVSLDDLKELGVPVRDASDYVAGTPEPVKVEEPVETQDRTLEIKAAADANPDAVQTEDKKEDKKSKKEDK